MTSGSANPASVATCQRAACLARGATVRSADRHVRALLSVRVWDSVGVIVGVIVGVLVVVQGG